MRLIDRFLPAASEPRRARLIGNPQPTADPATSSKLYGLIDRQPISAPITKPDSLARAGRSHLSRATGAAGLVVLVLLASVLPAHADTAVLALAGSVTDVLNNIRNWIMGILAGLATVFLTIGGVRRVMAGGDPGEHEKAKECFKSAGWGYGLAALAPLVVEILKGIVGA
ncbi:hypothetical protein LX86_008228 [Lentzea aerocolonigenes]|nr:hypothetical protein [Lentzea aerocolonigenes]